ncbi:Response regulator receiver domain-containing protein [Halopseudomonas xinjiangensis]|uniref:Response regulator receiver domain-containing protein n=1 Tax=Halopseudomonas xinjiangensis TaxID=487184 RepID=A0A1H1XJK9_9GAMM|nr:response regulator [Halopseudomonas xinjiangensis]SDT08896.1 Response regulator receiver domain-containing protein [Halopseudomonas xinjiangensis]
MAKVSVLVVDDAPFIRDLVKKALRSHFPGLQIEEAINGRKAQQVLSRAEFDLILCDWEMPEMNGLELLRWFRGQPGTGNTPFVMVTSRGDKENVVEAIQSGVSDYIGKPFSNEQLIAKVKKALHRSGRLALLQGAAPKSGSGTGQDTIAALTGNRRADPPLTPQPAKPRPVAPAEKPTSAAAEDTPAAQSVRGQAQLRLPGQQFACVIKTLSLRDALVVVRRSEQLPQVFESGVLDLEQDSDRSVARINAYVHAVASMETTMDCEWVKVTLRFVDQDPEKLDYLSRLIASGTAQQHYSPSA